MAAVATSRVTPARPTVAVAGRDDSSLAEGLLAMRVEEATDGLFRCEATFGNWGARGSSTSFLYFDRKLLDFGKELVLSVGGEALFRGRISGLEGEFPESGAPRLTVLAEDRYADLRTKRRTRTFTDMTDAAVFNQLATDHGMTADVSLDGPTHRVLAQLNQSDLAFLRDRARGIDAELWTDGSRLIARSRSGRSESAGAPLHLGYGNELQSFRVLADLAGQRTDLTVCGWDVSSKKALAETAGQSVVSGELAGGKSGASTLDALGARKERVVHSVPLTGQEARTRAECLYRGIARRFLTARGVASTSAALRVGATVRLEHLGPLFSGSYYVTSVTHLFDDSLGLRTEFTAERPGLGGGDS
jgi:phage protein D